MIVFPNAKINVGLHVVSRRPDGFRNLASGFYPVNWCDALEILPATALRFTASGRPIPGEAGQNLCWRAYELLRADFALPPVHLHLHKNIPIGAGLGGGSADAAFTLRLLNELFTLNIPAAQLEVYARQMGSDCAFFVQNKPVFATERGDVFENIPLNLSGYVCMIIYPNIHITTAEAYQNVTPRLPAADLRTLLQQPITTWRDRVQNDFEAALFPRYPILPALKQQLYAAGALYASLTGSGSAVYGIFPRGFTGTLPAAGPADVVWQGTL